jgi:hypothetical protein
MPTQQKDGQTHFCSTFLIKSPGAAAVKHLFHAAHNCHPWQDAPSAPSWRLFHKHSTTAALSIPTELSIHNGFPIPFL